jgi:hypothetical protein
MVYVPGCTVWPRHFGAIPDLGQQGPVFHHLRPFLVQQSADAGSEVGGRCSAGGDLIVVGEEGGGGEE